MDNKIKLTEEHTCPPITRRVYEGLGYRISVTVFDDDKEIICKPIDDILYQPQIIARSGKTLLEPVKISLNRNTVSTEIKYLQNAEELMTYLEENFDSL